MSILRSKGFWAITGSSAAVASAITYDNYQIKQYRQVLLKEASEYGERPASQDGVDRKVTLLLFASDEESLKRQRSIFRQFSVDLLTKAGIDYQLIELNAHNLDGEYYRALDEHEIATGQVTPETTEPKPNIFFANNVIRPVMKKWLNLLDGLKLVTDTDPIKGNVLEKALPQPDMNHILRDGIVALNSESFRALLWGYADWASSRRVDRLKAPIFGLVNCDFSNSIPSRLYYVLQWFRTWYF